MMPDLSSYTAFTHLTREVADALHDAELLARLDLEGAADLDPDTRAALLSIGEALVSRVKSWENKRAAILGG